jgi:7-carboxy-7-deazaguanine synthase
MKVNEIFFSIQGESSFMGRPCAFVRLAGCNLRCSYCDTGYAFSEGQDLSIAEVLDAVAAFPARLVLVTGGEPLLQGEVHELFRSLLDCGRVVCVETGGQMPVADVDPRVHKIMDLKCPSSGMQQHNRYENIEHLTKTDEVKFVVGDRADFEWACGVCDRYRLPSRVGTVLFSPVYQKLDYGDLAGWVMHCGFSARMQLQLHKIIWPGVARGV